MAAITQRATLFDPRTGNRKAVDVGSQRARQLFGEGYQIETPTNQFNPRSFSGGMSVAPQMSVAPNMSVAQQRPLAPNMNMVSGPIYGGAPRSITAPPLSLEELRTKNQATRGRVAGDVPTNEPARTLDFGAADSGLETTGTGFSSGEVPQEQQEPQAPRVSYQDAITQLLIQAQGGSGSQDLLEQRNKLINQRFGTVSAETPSNLQVLSPVEQANLRRQEAGGLEDQLAGIDTALKAREIKKSDALKLIAEVKNLFPEEKLPPSALEYQYAQKQGFEGSYEDYQNADANRKARALSTEGLDTVTAGRVDRIVNQFDGEAIVKKYNVVQEAANFVAELQKTKTSSNDQALISAFAKALDPESVVRESEYATVQKYAQSWAEQFGFKAERIFSNSPFLTETARKQMIATINSKYGVINSQYKNLTKNYTRRINNITGRSSGEDYLTNYSGAFEEQTSTQSGVSDPLDIRSPKAKGGDGAASNKTLSVTLPSGEVRQGGSASWRNQNPGNIKFNDFAKQYGATSGSEATDGGHFAAFPSEETGLRAQRDLLKNPNYTRLSLEAAMRRWSGQGYGADVAPPDIRNKTLAQMNNSEIERLIVAMRKREGWKEGKIIA